MKDNHLRVGQNDCDHGGGGINFTDNAYQQTPQNKEVVRYYQIDFTSERFPKRSRTLAEWKDLSTSELLRHLEEVHKEIFRRLGS